MFPVLFEVGGLPIQSYGFFIALGYVAALLLTRRLASARGLSAADFSDLTFFCLLVGILGARALFVLTNLTYYLGRPGEIFSFWSGGLVIYGGFLLVMPMLFLFFRFRGIPWRAGLDTLAPGLALDAHRSGFGDVFVQGTGEVVGIVEDDRRVLGQVVDQRIRRQQTRKERRARQRLAFSDRR